MMKIVGDDEWDVVKKVLLLLFLEECYVKVEFLFLRRDFEMFVVGVFIIFLKWIGSGEFFFRIKFIGMFFVEVFWFFW